MAAKKRVLVADDEQMWRDALKTTLEELGCVVDVASGFQEAWEFVDANDYMLVVSDNNMGLRGAGMELLRYIRKLSERNLDVPFILHTGDISSQDKEELEDLKGVCVLKYDPIHEVLQKQLEA